MPEWKFKKERETLIKMVEKFIDPKFNKNLIATDLVDAVIVAYIDYKSSGSGKGATGVYSQTARGNELTVGDKGKQVYGCPALKSDTPPEKPKMECSYHGCNKEAVDEIFYWKDKDTIGNYCREHSGKIMNISDCPHVRKKGEIE